MELTTIVNGLKRIAQMKGVLPTYDRMLIMEAAKKLEQFGQDAQSMEQTKEATDIIHGFYKEPDVHKKLPDDVIKSEEGYYDLYLLNMNAIFDGFKKEERGDAEGTADGSGQESGAEPEGGR